MKEVGGGVVCIYRVKEARSHPHGAAGVSVTDMAC
jgi:hypothetical protein